MNQTPRKAAFAKASVALSVHACPCNFTEKEAEVPGSDSTALLGSLHGLLAQAWNRR
jgi:hypothetical protein